MNDEERTRMRERDVELVDALQNLVDVALGASELCRALGTAPGDIEVREALVLVADALAEATREPRIIAAQVLREGGGELEPPSQRLP